MVGGAADRARTVAEGKKEEKQRMRTGASAGRGETQAARMHYRGIPALSRFNAPLINRQFTP